MKYRWRTHEWKVGDRCVVREREAAQTKPGTVRGLERVSLAIELDGGTVMYPHRAECIPLRKKPRPREWWIEVDEDDSNPQVFNGCAVKQIGCRAGHKQILVREVREQKELGDK